MILGPVVGLDFAGVVRHVAKNDNSHAFKVGDEVYGTVRGSLTPYCMVKSSSISHKPKTLSFAEAAALPTAYLTGFQGMFFFCLSLSLLKLSLELTHTHTHTRVERSRQVKKRSERSHCRCKWWMRYCGYTTCKSLGCKNDCGCV